MRILKNIWSQLHTFILWALISVIFWGWIMTLVTDTTDNKKVSIFINAYSVETRALAVELEKELPEGIKMVKVHSFEGAAAFGEYDFLNGDIYIVKAGEAELFRDSFKDIPGVKVYDAASGTGAGAEYIKYTAEGAEPEDYYLFYGINSMHCGDYDEAAFKVSESFMKLGEMK